MLDPINEIKSRLDIVDLISNYIKLTKAGANYKALCPFHSEKTPSLIVSPSKQIWHCFGACDQGGDIFKFVMQIEGLEFPDALRFLAEKAGVQLKKQDPKLQTKRAQAYEFNERACEYFIKCLEAYKPAQKYLQERGLTKKTIKEFRLGYAPQKTKVLNQFRNRIIFPISDLNGQIIAFTARVLDKTLPARNASRSDAGGPKYINSPDSLVYKKSLILYGFDKAKQAIRKKNLCILVEGNMDVIMSHQARVKNVAASSGSALSPDQIKIIKRLTNNLALAFDSDTAGSQATKRTIDLAIAEEMNVKIIILSEKDPADLIKKNKKNWLKAIKKAKPIMRYYFDDVFLKLDPKKLQGKKQISQILLPIIKKIPNKIEQAHYIQKLAGKIKIAEEILFEQIQNTKYKIPNTKYQIQNTNKKSRLERLQERLASLEKNELIIDEPEKEIKICKREIKVIQLKDKLQGLSLKIKKAETAKNKNLLKKLLDQFNHATKKINSYTSKN